MTFNIVKRPAAHRDIEECFVYIAENDLDIGISFLVAVEDSLDQLSKFPFAGRLKEFGNEELGSIRVWHVKGFENYLLFYSVGEGSVELIRVLHGARDIENLFT